MRERKIALTLHEMMRRRRRLINRRNEILDSVFKWRMWPWTSELKRIDEDLDRIDVDITTLLKPLQDMTFNPFQ